MTELTKHFLRGKAAHAARAKHGKHEYLDVLQRDARFAGRTKRWVQREIELFEALDRLTIGPNELDAYPDIKHGSIRNRLDELSGSKTMAIKQLREWSGETAREATHKRRKAPHPDFSDGVAVVMRAIDLRWNVTFAVERGLKNFACRAVLGLTETEAVGFAAGVGWSARKLLLQVHSAPVNPEVERLLGLVDTEIVLIGPRDQRATPPGALSALGARPTGASLERVCDLAGWPVPTGGDQDTQRAICLLAVARIGRRRGPRRQSDPSLSSDEVR